MNQETPREEDPNLDQFYPDTLPDEAEWLRVRENVFAELSKIEHQRTRRRQFTAGACGIIIACSMFVVLLNTRSAKQQEIAQNVITPKPQEKEPADFLLAGYAVLPIATDDDVMISEIIAEEELQLVACAKPLEDSMQLPVSGEADVIDYVQDQNEKIDADPIFIIDNAP